MPGRLPALLLGAAVFTAVPPIAYQFIAPMLGYNTWFVGSRSLYAALIGAIACLPHVLTGSLCAVLAYASWKSADENRTAYAFLGVACAVFGGLYSCVYIVAGPDSEISRDIYNLLQIPYIATGNPGIDWSTHWMMWAHAFPLAVIGLVSIRSWRSLVKEHSAR